MHKPTLALGIVMTTVMAVMIIIGAIEGGFVDGLEIVWGNVWGKVTLVDLALGFVLVGAWIAVREGSVADAVPWWIGLAFTGNFIIGIYLIRVGLQSTTLREVLLGES